MQRDIVAEKPGASRTRATLLPVTLMHIHVEPGTKLFIAVLLLGRILYIAEQLPCDLLKFSPRYKGLFLWALLDAHG